MSEKARLDTMCPNNHDLAVSITRDEFEAALKTDSLMLHCNTCEANWPPSKQEIESMRRQFEQP